MLSLRHTSVATAAMAGSSDSATAGEPVSNPTTMAATSRPSSRTIGVPSSVEPTSRVLSTRNSTFPTGAGVSEARPCTTASSSARTRCASCSGR